MVAPPLLPQMMTGTTASAHHESVTGHTLATILPCGSRLTSHASLANGIGPRGADFGRTPVRVSAVEHAAWAGVLERQRQPVLLNIVEARLQCPMDLFI